MKLVAFGDTDTGVRPNNEDAFLVLPEYGLYVVSDGMGGHAAGDIASAAAIAVIRRYFNESYEVLRQAYERSSQEVLSLVSDAVELACLRVHQLATRHRDLQGMGATLTMLLLIGDHAFVAHVGDSRLYLRRDERIHQISQDHTVAQELVAKGLLNAAEADEHEASNILTRAIGADSKVQVDVASFEVKGGDTFLLCSDGLSGYLGGGPNVLLPFLSQTDLSTVPRQLITLAGRNGSDDNITAVAVRIAEDPDATSPLLLGLDRAQLARVLKLGQVLEFGPGDLVAAASGANDKLFLLLSGALSLTTNPERPQTVLPKRVLRVSSLLGVPVRGAIHAREASRVLILPAAELLQLLREDLEIGTRVWSSLARHLASTWDEQVGEAIVA
ncbi:MAG: protein phosphatase 2C domain-containing protein [Myxococcales bacterium]|nr:protein phosphatase 2C domain-containing protein [Myxococcales bacterium]